MNHQTQFVQEKRKKFFAEVFQGAGLALAIFGGVVGTFGYLNRTEALKFQQQGQLTEGTIAQKYQERNYSSRGRARKGYYANIYYFEQPESSTEETSVREEIETAEDLEDFVNSIDPVKDFAAPNWDMESGNARLTAEQHRTLTENSKVDIYYIPNQEGQIALKSWVDSHTQKSALSAYSSALLFVIPGTILILWGTFKKSQL